MGAVTAVAGVSLLAGGLLFGGGLVSAQTPEPTAPQGQTAPVDPTTPADPNATPHDKADCPNMGGSSGSSQAPSQGDGASSGVSFRHGGMRGL
ncbi:MAG TPA: hypothetical protein VI759_06665 [Dehalococcoidia bacterium]|nr:hypothetical protein [Dehalococcoidia bacterium]